MKLTISKRELLALTSHVIGSQRQWTPEQAAQRLKAWGELGVAELALDLADAISANLPLNAMSVWMDRKTTTEADLTPTTLAFLLNQLKGTIGTEHVDVLAPVVDRLKALNEAR